MKKIILDCDPGHDDMMAIILAVASKEIDLLGVTTVAGNQIGEKTYKNALKTLTLIGENGIPVARGFNKPIIRELHVAPEIHGVSGLDGANLPEPEFEGLNMHAVEFIEKTLEEVNEPITLVPVGPLTNIGVFLLKRPDLKGKIEEIVLMGGAFHDSNVTPASEFNIFVDPEAAKIVFESGIPITMVGLDVTNKALISYEDIDKLEKKNGKVSSIIAPLLRFFANANKEIFNFSGAPLHDPLAVAYVIDKSILTTKFLNVEIETKGELTSGQTVVDYYGVTGKKPNVNVALDLDLEKFKKFIFDAIDVCDKKFE